jgi:hypothetical protein
LTFYTDDLAALVEKLDFKKRDPCRPFDGQWRGCALHRLARHRACRQGCTLIGAVPPLMLNTARSSRLFPAGRPDIPETFGYIVILSTSSNESSSRMQSAAGADPRRARNAAGDYPRAVNG